jgi:hypothetical protein
MVLYGAPCELEALTREERQVGRAKIRAVRKAALARVMG